MVRTRVQVLAASCTGLWNRIPKARVLFCCFSSVLPRPQPENGKKLIPHGNVGELKEMLKQGLTPGYLVIVTIISITIAIVEVA